MKKVFSIIFIGGVSLMTLYLISCGKNDLVKAVSGVTVMPTAQTMTVGETFSITATVSPADATNKKVSWSSSALNVAAVDGGTVTALKAGEAVITVTTEDGHKTATVAVTVNAKKIPVAAITLNKGVKKLVVDDSFVLEATVFPEDAFDKRVTWSSDNDKIVTVDEKGVVKALAVGEASVIVKSVDGDVSAVCKFTIVERNIHDVPGSEL